MVTARASRSTLSGNQIGPGNTVAYNTFNGVVVDTGTGNRIVANSIHDNGGKGIVLLNGGNHNLEAPDLASAVRLAGGTAVYGTVTVPPNASYFVEFFAGLLPVASWSTPKAAYAGSRRRCARVRPCDGNGAVRRTDSRSARVR